MSAAMFSGSPHSTRGTISDRTERQSHMQRTAGCLTILAAARAAKLAKVKAGDLECHASSPSPGQRCICIERDTERVLQCQVLRCQERARRNFVIDQGQEGLSETMVCEAHAAALKAGERYVYNSVENVIYMGQDAPPQSE